MTQGKSVPGRQNSRDKGPGAEVCEACLNNSKEASMVGEGGEAGGEESVFVSSGCYNKLSPS